MKGDQFKSTVSDKNILQGQKSDWKMLKDDIASTMTKSRNHTCYDVKEAKEQRQMVGVKLENIEKLEQNVLALELELSKINETQMARARIVEIEREKLKQEISDLHHLKQKAEVRQMICGLVWELAMPKELFSFQQIDELLEKHRSEIDRMERTKMGKTPSEIAVIDRRIVDLETNFNKELGKLNFHNNADGRQSFYDKSGKKRYLNEFALKADDIGDYYIDEFGQKKYTKKYAYDDFGRYYLNDAGIRIYKSTPYSPEYRLQNGILRRAVSPPATAQTKHNDDDKHKFFANYEAGQSVYLDFLVSNYTKPLVEALAKIVINQPIDPIDYLEKYLAKFHCNQQRKMHEQQFFAELAQQRRIVATEMYSAAVGHCIQ